MITDEEKEALRNFKSEYETCDHYSSDLIIELDDAEIILNIIEKQSKEIEELKRQIPQDKIFYYSEKDYTSNDKIKAKIEEYKELLYSYKKDLEEKLHYVDKESMNCIIAQIQVLESLLKKE